MRARIDRVPVLGVMRGLAALLGAALSLLALADAPPPVPTVLWRARADGPIRAAVALDGDQVVFGSSDGILRAVDRADGRERWRRDLGESLDAAPAIANGRIVVVGRSGGIFALSTREGRVLWQRSFDAALPFPGGWDYRLAAPTIAGERVIVGGADGSVRALALASGRALWRIDTPARVRSGATVAGRRVVVGGSDGLVRCLDLATGAILWTFRSDGADIDLEKAGYDRRTITAQQIVDADTVYVGSRDGHFYAIALADGSRRWSWDGGTWWICARAVRVGDVVAFGSSDGRYVQALDAKTGVARWRTPVDGNVLGDLALRGTTLIATTHAASTYDVGADGNTRMLDRERASVGSVYALDASDGRILSRLPLAAASVATAVGDGAREYVGADDGFLLALDPQATSEASAPTERVVFFSDAPKWTWFKNGAAVRDYFETRGYARLDDASLVAFFERNATSDAPSVVVLATDILPEAAFAPTPAQSPFRRYLDAGGKIVSVGALPGQWLVAPGHDQPTGGDTKRAAALLGLALDREHPIELDDQAPLRVTHEGARWGLRAASVGTMGWPADRVDATLVESGSGRALAWVKSFSTRRDRGFVRLYGRMDGLPDLADVARAAELGLP